MNLKVIYFGKCEFGEGHVEKIAEVCSSVNGPKPQIIQYSNGCTALAVGDWCPTAADVTRVHCCN